MEESNHEYLISFFKEVYNHHQNELEPTDQVSGSIRVFNDDHVNELSVFLELNTQQTTQMINAVQLKIEQLYNEFIATGVKDECLNSCTFLGLE